jgi:hypothetical protein
MSSAVDRAGNDSQEWFGRAVEEQLPACVQHVLQAARAARPERELVCVGFRTLNGERLAARQAAELLHARDILVLSVSVTETTLAAVRTDTHVLIVHMQQRRCSGTSIRGAAGHGS